MYLERGESQCDREGKLFVLQYYDWIVEGLRLYFSGQKKDFAVIAM